jgi:glycerol-3-phosphate acyltransferase PlsY
MSPLFVIAAAAGYLLGSLPFGYLVARSKGVDIFAVGSRSSGATNVRRVLGNGPGYLVFALDAVKGAVAAGWPLLYVLWRGLSPADAAGMEDPTNLLGVLGLTGALVGHSFSCFTGFRGGKGVATGAGGFAVLFPSGAGIAIGVFALVLALTRYVSLGSMLAAATLPLSAWLLHRSGLIIGVSAAVAVFVAVRHRANIARLAAGTENKIGRGAK